MFEAVFAGAGERRRHVVSFGQGTTEDDRERNVRHHDAPPFRPFLGDTIATLPRNRGKPHSKGVRKPGGPTAHCHNTCLREGMMSVAVAWVAAPSAHLFPAQNRLRRTRWTNDVATSLHVVVAVVVVVFIL